MAAEDWVQRIEHYLSQYYGFNPVSPSLLHLVTLQEMSDEEKASLSQGQELQRAGVLCDDRRPGNLYLGIYLADSIKEQLDTLPPAAHWQIAHLDAFLVAVEEISHFHLISNRAVLDRSVSLLELECQAEVDKFLVGALHLTSHLGAAKLGPLFELLFEQASFSHAAKLELYETASHFAGKFLKNILRQGQHHSSILWDDKTRELFKAFYRANWTDKQQLLNAA